MVRFRQTRLKSRNVTENDLALHVSIACHTKGFCIGGLECLRELDFLARFEDPPILVGDVGHHARFRVLELQSRLRLGVLLRLDLLSFSPQSNTSQVA